MIDLIETYIALHPWLSVIASFFVGGMIAIIGDSHGEMQKIRKLKPRPLPRSCIDISKEKTWLERELRRRDAKAQE